jgi:hypothetical protein
MGIIKTTYINQMCNKLYKRATNKLDLIEGGHLSYIKRSNKRAHKVGDIGSRTSGVQSAKIYRVSIINDLSF